MSTFDVSLTVKKWTVEEIKWESLEDVWPLYNDEPLNDDEESQGASLFPCCRRKRKRSAKLDSDDKNANEFSCYGFVSDCCLVCICKKPLGRICRLFSFACFAACLWQVFFRLPIMLISFIPLADFVTDIVTIVVYGKNEEWPYMIFSMVLFHLSGRLLHAYSVYFNLTGRTLFPNYILPQFQRTLQDPDLQRKTHVHHLQLDKPIRPTHGFLQPSVFTLFAIYVPFLMPIMIDWFQRYDLLSIELKALIKRSEDPEKRKEVLSKLWIAEFWLFIPFVGAFASFFELLISTFTRVGEYWQKGRSRDQFLVLAIAESIFESVPNVLLNTYAFFAHDALDGLIFWMTFSASMASLIKSIVKFIIRFEKIKDAIIGTDYAKMLMLGNYGAGRTSLLYRWKLGEVGITTIPTVGFNVENIRIQSTDIEVWELSCNEKIYALSKYYIQSTDCIVWVVDHLEWLKDSQEQHERCYETLKYSLTSGVSEHAAHGGRIPLVIIITKMDIPDHYKTWSADKAKRTFFEQLKLENIVNEFQIPILVLEAAIVDIDCRNTDLILPWLRKQKHFAFRHGNWECTTTFISWNQTIEESTEG